VAALYELEKHEDVVVTINPESRSFGSDGGAGEVEVSASADTEWTAKSDASWITVTHGTGGIDSFETHTITTSADYPHSVYAADMDGDGDMDALSASWDDNTIAWYENDGSENFTAHPITTSANHAVSVYAADMDGDGDVDVFSASAADDTIACLV